MQLFLALGLGHAEFICSPVPSFGLVCRIFLEDGAHIYMGPIDPMLIEFA